MNVVAAEIADWQANESVYEWLIKHVSWLHQLPQIISILLINELLFLNLIIVHSCLVEGSFSCIDVEAFWDIEQFVILGSYFYCQELVIMEDSMLLSFDLILKLVH